MASPHSNETHACPVDSAATSFQGGRLRLASIFSPDCMEFLSPSTTKPDVIRLLVGSLVNNRCLDRRHQPDVSDQFIKREGYGSSAIGKGLAFPHLRTKLVPVFVGAIGVAPSGIDFDALDQEPTRLVFLTLSPIQFRAQHVDLLSRLVRLLKDKAARLQLRQLTNRDDIYRCLCDMDDCSEMSLSSEQGAASGGDLDG